MFKYLAACRTFDRSCNQAACMCIMMMEFASKSHNVYQDGHLFNFDLQIYSN